MDPGQQSTQQSISQRFTFQRNESTNGSFNLFVEHEFPDWTVDFQLDLYELNVETEHERLYGYRFEDGSKLIWDQETPNPKAHITLSLGTHADSWYKDTDTWTLSKRPLYSVVHRGHNIDETFDVAGEGAVSERGDILYLGPHREWATAVDGQRIRLVVPEAATLEADPQHVLYMISFAALVLDVSCKDDSVLAVAVPTSEAGWGSSVGIATGQSGFWVRDDAPAHAVGGMGGCTWVHEYVHTRQGFKTRLTSATSWLTEGIASYYAGLLPYLQGLITSDELYAYLTPYVSGASARLAQPQTFEGSATAEAYDYYKGRMVIAALDWKIRRDTGGAVSFKDVFYRLNTYEEQQITYSWLVSLLEKIPGSSGYETWFEKHVKEDAVPEIPTEFSYLD